MLAALRSLALFLAVLPVVGSVGQAAASPSVRTTATTTRLLVQFDEHVSATAQNAALARVGARRLDSIGQLSIAVAAVPARAEKAAVRGLGESPIVAYVERDGRAQANEVSTSDPYLGSTSWQLENLNLPDAWSLSTGSASIVIAVLDSGVDRRHEDLGAFVPGHNFVDGGVNTSDGNGHGTAVTGVVAAQGGNGKGITGVCWKCRIMPVKVLGADNSGSWSDVASGVIWATTHGARVINMSLGLPKGSRAIAAAVSYAIKHNVVVVASSGNENSTKPDYPSAYPGVLSVGAVDETSTRYSTSNHNVRYGKWGSNYGSWVDVDAPGCVNSTWPTSPSHPSGNYTYFCGTSASAPFVAGLAGLALSYAPTASAAQVVDAIESTARQTTDKNSAHGLIDAKATLEVLMSPPPTSTTSSPNATAAKISARLTRKAFDRLQAPKVKLVYSFSSPSASFTYRLERKSGSSWQLVHNVKRDGNFRGSHSLTVKQLFGNATVGTGHYRVALSADASHSLLGFRAK